MVSILNQLHRAKCNYLPTETIVDENSRVKYSNRVQSFPKKELESATMEFRSRSTVLSSIEPRSVALS